MPCSDFAFMPARKFRSRFQFPSPKTIYLDGNSLGLLPHATRSLLGETVDHEWGEYAIDSWNRGWFELPRQVGNRLAPLIGASHDELVFCDNVSINLYKLAWAALQLNPAKKAILTDDLNFPSDRYILEGVVQNLQRGHRIVQVDSPDGIHLPPETLEARMDDDLALLYLTHVAFKSGFMHDMKRLTDAAHRAGALVLWDLSHSTGAVPLDLEAAGVDFAVGCSYKYLNGGPGAPAFLYVRKALQERLSNPIPGWFGADAPFAFNLKYTPAPGITRFLTGTPPILSLRAIEPGIELLNEVGMDNIRRASLTLTGRFIQEAHRRLVPLGYKIGTPVDPESRGSHVCLRHLEGRAINQILQHPTDTDLRIVPDFRAPDNIRFGFAPLYNLPEEVDQTIDRLETIVSHGLYRSMNPPEQPVT